MNNIIKRVIIILIINSSLLTTLSSQEFTIVIPEKFNRNQFPLPPFPKQVINRLEVINYENEIFEKEQTRWVKQEEIPYNYYSSILKNNIDKKGYLNHLGQVESDFETVELLYKTTYQSNFNKIEASIQYDIRNILLNLDASYYDYRLPIELGLNGSLENKSISLFIGKSYYNIDYKKNSVTIDGITCDLKDSFFPTIDPEQPYSLTSQEKSVIRDLQRSFLYSDKLQEHVKFLFSKGSVYSVINNNLLYHGCILMNEDMTFKERTIDGVSMGAKDYLDYADKIARQGYFSNCPIERQNGQDMMWYLWSGKESPLFGKDKMSSFERYFTDNKELMIEKKNAYYKFRDNKEVCIKILNEFVLNINSQYPLPEHLFFVYVPVEICQERINSRGDEKELFDAKEYQIIVNDFYHKAIKYFEDSDMAIHIIDGTKTPEEITNEIVNIIR